MRRRLLTGSSVVFGATLVSQGLLVLSGPLAFRLLGAEGRGEIAFVFAGILLAAQIAPFGAPQAWAYVIAEKGSRPAAMLRSFGPAYLGRSIVVGVLGAAAIGTLAWVTGNHLSRPVAELVTAAIGIVVLMLAQLAIGIAQGESRYSQLAAMQMVPGITYVAGLTILSVAGLADLRLVFGIYFVGWALATVWILNWHRRAAGADGLLPDQGEVNRYARRAGGSASTPIDTLGVDQLLVGVLLGHAGLGNYTVSLAFATPAIILLASLGTAWMPRMAKLTDARSRREFGLRSMGIGVLLGVAIIGMVEVLLGPVTRLAFGADAMSAVSPTRLLVVAGLLLGIRRLAGALLYGMGRPAVATASEVVGFAVMVTGMLTLAPTWGLYGAAAAMTLAGATAAVGVCAALAFLPRLDSASAPQSDTVPSAEAN